MNSVMDHPFPKAVSPGERYERLLQVVRPEDRVGVIISADPDAMASALTLKRLFWRKVRNTRIYYINAIKRAGNLAFTRLLNMDMRYVKYLKRSEITKLAIVDSQPHHNEGFKGYAFDIIIDHHPMDAALNAAFIDIKPDYGATSTILAEYLRAAKLKPSPRLATALLYGIKTDTHNFAQESLPNDINAFRYLYRYANMGIIKKLESSDISKETLPVLKKAIENALFTRDTAFAYMDKGANPDTLVIIADFFVRVAEVTWSIISGIHGKKLIVIIRNAGFRGDAHRLAQEMFGELGFAGGHRTAARAEIPLAHIGVESGESEDYKGFLLGKMARARSHRFIWNSSAKKF